MKKVLIIFILIFILICPAYASEITGQISTDPRHPSGQAGESLPPAEGDEGGQLPTVENNQVHNPVVIVNPGPMPKVENWQIKPEIKIENKINTETKQNLLAKIVKKEIKVLGARLFASGDLLRSESGQIFIIQNKFKKPIRTFAELAAYRGRQIQDASHADLAQNEARPFLDNEFIRLQGDKKVYVIKNGRRQRISNPSGQTAIHDITYDEMKLYFAY